MSVDQDLRRARSLGPLSRGDRVALVAPAGPTPPDQLAAAEATVASWGLQPVVYPSATALHPWASYLSGPDRQRARDVEDAWCDPEVAGVFALRGGYGSVRILDLLDRDRMRAAQPKPLYGSSDVTALHEWVREQLGVASWLTPMIGTSSALGDAAALAALRVAVLGEAGVLGKAAGQGEVGGHEGRRWSSPGAEVLVPGTATGVLIGGNLSLLAMTLGARRRPALDNAGAIALLEDVTEDTYRIDGYLTSLLRGGWFDGVVGVALGSWRECGPLIEIRDLCLELLAPLGIPIVWELGFGHGPASHSIPLGQVGTLVAEPAGPPALVVGARLISGAVGG